MRIKRHPRPRRVWSSHAADRLSSIVKLKRDFAEEFYDPVRFQTLAAKEALGNITHPEQLELERLTILRRWRCDCQDCQRATG